jgi:hypothetical protein
MTEEFDPTLDSPARNALRVYSHCLQVQLLTLRYFKSV